VTIGQIKIESGGYHLYEVISGHRYRVFLRTSLARAVVLKVMNEDLGGSLLPAGMM